MSRYEQAISGWRRIEGTGPLFPGRLSRLPVEEVPGAIWVAGELPPPAAVAIVGTRSPDAHGLALAERLARECALRNIAVVSGGASGIDGAAHRSCIESGGRTAVILAGGLRRPHPPGNADLFVLAVESGGCLLTDQPPDVPAKPFLFLKRNRLIAALSMCVVIVQARWRSGALSTASWATACSSRLYACAGSPASPLFHGTNKLIGDGKAGIIVSMETFFKEIAPTLHLQEPVKAANSGKGQCELEDCEGRVMRLVGSDPMSIDEVAAHLEMGPDEVSRIIFNLEMKGALLAADPGRYVAAPDFLSKK